MDADTARVLGIRCYQGDLGSAAREILERIRSGRGGHACFYNAHVAVRAQHDPELRSALEAAWRVFPDGASVAWLSGRLGHATARIGGPDLMPKIFDLGRETGTRHFLYGATDRTLARLAESLEREFPGAQVVGMVAPTFGPIDDGRFEADIEAIRAAAPDLVWVALGAPKQELWMQRYAAELAPAVCLGVGAAFDFIAGEKRRAPLWMQSAGLEWLHRLAAEPRRLATRYLFTNTEFIFRAALQLADGRARSLSG